MTKQHAQFDNDVDTIYKGVDGDATAIVDIEAACEDDDAAEQTFDLPEKLQFLPTLQTCSNTDLKPDFLLVESGPAYEELDEQGARLQRNIDHADRIQHGPQNRDGHSPSSEKCFLGFASSVSGTSRDYASWVCNQQDHPNQTNGGPQTLHADIPWNCSLCGKGFSHVRQLKLHERVHIEEKVYSCARCGRQFPQLCRLKRHMRVHTGEKPFRCAKCGKYFAHANNLKVHQSVHTGERRFSCTQCGKNFSFLSNLIRHKAVHSGK